MKFKPFTQKIQITKAGNFFAMVSHAPLFLLLLIGKLSLHISKRNLVSASGQLGHRFRLTYPSVELFSLLSRVLVEDAAEDDVLRRGEESEFLSALNASLDVFFTKLSKMNKENAFIESYAMGEMFWPCYRRD